MTYAIYTADHVVGLLPLILHTVCKQRLEDACEDLGVKLHMYNYMELRFLMHTRVTCRQNDFVKRKQKLLH